MEIVQFNWKRKFKYILNNASDRVVISSPYVTKPGIDFLIENLTNEFKKN